MFRRLLLTSFTVIITTFQVKAWAENIPSKLLNNEQMVIYQPFVRGLPPAQPVTAAFFGIENRLSESLTLIKASTTAAERIELHTHTMSDGMMRMRELESIQIPAKGRFKFAPGAYHLMLINLKKPLMDGEKVWIELDFAEGFTKKVEFTVRSVLKE